MSLDTPTGGRLERTGNCCQQTLSFNGLPFYLSFGSFFIPSTPHCCKVFANPSVGYPKGRAIPSCLFAACVQPKLRLRHQRQGPIWVPKPHHPPLPLAPIDLGLPHLRHLQPLRRRPVHHMLPGVGAQHLIVATFRSCSSLVPKLKPRSSQTNRSQRPLAQKPSKPQPLARALRHLLVNLHPVVRPLR